MMARYKDWQGYYILDDYGVCLAKTCSKCKMELPSEKFSPSSSDKLGLKSCCKSCHSLGETARIKAIREANPKRMPVDWDHRLNRTDDQVNLDQMSLHPTGKKVCSHCIDLLPLEVFGRVLRHKDGLDYACRDCVRIAARRQDPNVNKKSTKKYQANLKRRTPEEVLRDRDAAHPDGTKRCRTCGIVKTVSSYYTSSSTRSGLLATCKKCHVKSSVRRKSERDRKYWISHEIPLECYVCLTPWVPGFHSDHVIPKNLGGDDGSPNRLPLCPAHNASKWMTPLEIWLRESMPEKMDEVLDRVTGYGVDYSVPEGLYNGVRVFTDCGGHLQWERINDSECGTAQYRG